MINGMFQDTMVNMTWADIQDHVNHHALVILPLGVLEEHGPHLCIGTDIYIAHIQSVFVKQQLENRGMRVVIAPPFYWGICQSTGGFIGSFHVRKETAKSLLFDILASLAGFGFRDVYGVNAHGDIEHNIFLIEAFRDASETLRINASYTFSESIMHHYGLNSNEPFICPIKQQVIQVSMSNYADVHAGDIETATINYFYPDLVDTQLAKQLPPVRLEDDKIMTWLYGGHTKQLSPEGYVGAPADYVTVETIKNINDIADRVAQAIFEHMGRQEAN